MRPLTPLATDTIPIARMKITVAKCLIPGTMPLTNSILIKYSTALGKKKRPYPFYLCAGSTITENDAIKNDRLALRRLVLPSILLM